MWLFWLCMNLILMGWCYAVLSISAVAASVPDQCGTKPSPCLHRADTVKAMTVVTQDYIAASVWEH